MSDDFTNTVRTAAGPAWKGPTTPPPRDDARWNAHLQCWMVPIEAIAAEREACAKIAEAHVPPQEAARAVDWALCIRDANLSTRIATAIRARKTEDEG